ncbi:hypothetical protein [Burkholderia stagnalis]
MQDPRVSKRTRYTGFAAVSTGDISVPGARPQDRGMRRRHGARRTGSGGRADAAAQRGIGLLRAPQKIFRGGLSYRVASSVYSAPQTHVLE